MGVGVKCQVNAGECEGMPGECMGLGAKHQVNAGQYMGIPGEHT